MGAIGWLPCPFFILLTAIILAEIKSRGTAISPASGLLWVHLVFDLGFVAAMAGALRWNGRRYPEVHWRFVYGAVSMFALVLITGGVLLYRLP